MKEVKKCSISGVAFTLDTDAYEALAAYLESLKKAYKDSADGAEIVADIEARIAELILSAQDNARVVEKPLIMNIIGQLGTAEDIAPDADADLQHETPRIPRRLYRDTENAKLGGVCAGIGKYFDIDPVWVRLMMFLPLLLTCFGWLPFLYWTGPMMGNLFGIFLICYFIMWFAVPAARTARQKLEMNGERITAQSVAEVTAASAADTDADSRAKPIVAEAVSVFGKVVLILMKIFAGLLVFGLIMAACALIIGLFAVLVGGHEIMQLGSLSGSSLWVPVLGILVALIPAILLIYVLMCLIASRKPGGKTVLVIFLLWLGSIIACCSVAIHENFPGKLREKRQTVRQLIKSKVEVEIDGDITTLEQLLEDLESEETDRKDSAVTSLKSKNVDRQIDRTQKSSGSEKEQVTVRANVRTGERADAARGTSGETSRQP